jgi:uncharacterized protein (TIGR02646 family)
MIKVTRRDAPAELTVEKGRELTAAYLADSKKNVWNQPWIRKTLLDMSANKCVYCEVKLQSDGYLRVDHFWCRDNHKHKVVEWSNLLPCCGICNGKKSNLDVSQEPFIDLTIDFPKEHLQFSNCLLIGRDDKGANTQRTLQLNFRYTEKWFAITNATHGVIETVWAKARAASGSLRASDCEDFSASLSALLKQADKKREFSAVVASSIKIDPRMPLIIETAEALSVWGQEENILWGNIQEVALI